MRLALTAAVLVLLFVALQPAAAQSPAPAAAESAGAGNPSDAAEKHAKRSACLKDAKAKKLVGARKTAFLKDCMSAPPASKPLTSASSARPG